MDTIVIASGMPFLLAFLDQPLDDVVALWESWERSGESVAVRHENPSYDAVVRLRPAALGVVQFVRNEPAGRLFGERTLWTLPTLSRFDGADDFAPEHGHYWTLQMGGFTATPETLPDGRTGLILGQWEFGRL